MLPCQGRDRGSTSPWERHFTARSPNGMAASLQEDITGVRFPHGPPLYSHDLSGCADRTDAPKDHLGIGSWIPSAVKTGLASGTG